MPIAAKAVTSNLPSASAVAPPRPDWVPDELFPFESRFLEIDGQQLHYVDEGSGPLLVMVPGSPMWSFMYRGLIADLASRYRCIAIDLPGLGLSQVELRRGRAFQSAAEWLDRFVGALGLNGFTLLVHATAGPPALEMAVRRHRSVRGLVITNSFAWPLDGTPRLSGFVKLVSSRPFAWANVGFNLMARITARVGRRTGPFSADEQRAIAGPFRERATRRHLQNYLLGVRVEREMFALLQKRLDVFDRTPALLLYGRHDNGYAAGFLDRWRQTLPDHTAIVLDEAGHFPNEDAPEAYREAVATWLSRHVSYDSQ